MKIQNPIGWCDETTNAVTGCDKVSPGCKNCYAATGTRARVLRANGIETWGPKGVRHPVAEYATKLRRLNKLCICDKCHTTYPISQWGDMANRPPFGLMKCLCGSPVRRIRLFADSNSDWLDDKWPVETLASFLDAIRLAPNVDVQLLTKRPENFEKRLLECQGQFKDGSPELGFIYKWCKGGAPTNVWLGVSVENQAMADLRIPQLLKIPAARRFLSCEPLLEPLEFSNVTHRSDAVEQLGKPALSGIDWVIVGGESGPHRRPVPVEAILSIHDQCKAAGVPCYVKQDVALINGQQGRIPDAVFNCKEFPR